jgi:hypothetical protein
MNDFHDEFSHLGPSQHFHAIGMLIVLFSLTETWLHDLLHRYLPVLPKEALSSIFDTLNNRQRMDLIKALSTQEADEESREMISQILTAFEVCAENRNLIAHAWPTFSHEEGDAAMHMVKPPRRDPAGLANYYFELHDVQQAAKDCWVCGSMLHTVVDSPLGEPIPLSGKLPIPSKLSLRRNPKARSDVTPPPEPSSD